MFEAKYHKQKYSAEYLEKSEGKKDRELTPQLSP